MEDQSLAATRRLNEASEIITSGHVWSAVWYLAWPTAISTLIQTAYNIINRVFLGHLGDGAEPALAAVGIGGAVLMMQFSLMLGLSIGTSALVSRFLGAGNREDAEEATRQSLILSVIGGVATMLPLVLVAGPVVKLVGAKGPVVPLAAGYTTIIACASAPMFLYMTTTTVLRSAGDVRSPLYAGALMLGLNVVFDWLLIFGIGPFPALGVRGAAISTSISRVVGMILIFLFLARSGLGGSLAHVRARPEWFGRITNIGGPAAIQHLLFTTAFAGYIKVLAYLPNPTAAQAAVTVASAIESVAFMPGVAYAIAATPLVGQNLGAGKPDRAQHSAWVATGQAAAFMSLVAVLFITIPKQLALAFTTDASVLPLIVSYLRINAIAEPFLAVAIVLRGALQGAGETRVPAWVTFITSWVIRLPLAWLLAIRFDQGATGAWIAMCATTILSGLLMAAWFTRGTWRTVRV